MRKTTINHGDFLLNTLLMFGLLATAIINLFTFQFSDRMYYYMLSIFLFFEFAYNLKNLLVSMFETIESDALATVVQFKDRIHICEHFGMTKTLDDPNKGLSVSFRDVHYKKKVTLKKLIIQNGEKIGIIGKGSNLLVAILKRLVKLDSGEIHFGDENILMFEPKFYDSIFGVVPVNTKITNGTIE